MAKINIKPLSTNALHTGKRHSSKDYLIFEKELYYQLPPMTIPEGNLCLNVVFGVSSELADLDNCLKGTIDVLAKKYQFNDKRIFEMHVFKEITKKGKEYIDFSII